MRKALVPLAAGIALSGVLAMAWLLPPPGRQSAENDADAPMESAAQAPKVEVASRATRGLAAHPLAKLARRAPKSAWRQALALEQSPQRAPVLRAIAGLWMAQDPASAMAAFEAADDDLISTGWIAEKLAVWMTKDEAASAQWAWSLTPWRRADLFAGALDHLLNYGKPASAVVALGERLLRRWAEDDPAAAWEVASGDRRRSYWARVVAQAWAERDPRAALGAATRMDIWLHSSYKPWILEIMAKWAEADARSATEWALRAAPSEGRPLAAVAHASLSVASPEEAAALEVERVILDDAAYWEQLRKLLGDDPRALAEWMARQPDERLRIGKARRIAKLYGEAAPFEAARWASELPPEESGQALAGLMPSIARADFGFAEDVVLGANSAEAQTAAARELLRSWPEDLGGPAGAYQWAAENLPPAVRLEATEVVFSPWGRQAPAAAAAAWEDIADPDERLAKGFSVVDGMWRGRRQDAPWQLHERMVALDNVYRTLLRITPTNPQYLFYHVWLASPPPNPDIPEGRSLPFDLHRYWKDRDPSRAAKYEDILENYSGPPPPDDPTEHRERWAQYEASRSEPWLRQAWREHGSDNAGG